MVILFVWDAWENMIEFGRGGAYVPARVALQGRIHHLSLRIIRVFWVWKRRYADVRAGTQAPPLRILLERITRGCSPLHISFGQIARGCITEMGREESSRRKSWRMCLLHQAHGFGLFHEQGHEWFALVGHLIVEHGILQGLF